MDILDKDYWDTRYKNEETGWDIGYPNPAITRYFENVSRDAQILIPGCGNAYEGEALFEAGFTNLTLLDYSPSSKHNFLNRVPEFPEDRYLVGDFFEHQGSYDFIVEQTFFCAIDPGLRSDYVHYVHSLLKPDGILTGVLFKIPLFDDHPPFGGNEAEYRQLFSGNFEIKQMVPSVHSIPQRRESELYIELVRRKVN